MANISSKHPDYNKEFETGDIDLFKPEFKRDSKGSYFMQLPGYGKWMVSNTPGSKIISQGSEKEDGSAATNPDSLSSGSLSTDTVIRIGEYVYLDGDQGLIAVGDYEKRVDTSMSIGGNGFYGYSGNDLVLAFFLKANGDFDKGDAIIGDYTSDNYILWDDSAGLLYVRGDIIVEGDIESANYVAGISGYKLTYASGLAEFQEGLIGDWEIDTCLKKEYTISTPSKSKIELCPGNPGHIQVAYSPTGSFSLPGDTYMVQLTQGSTGDAGGVPISRLDIYRDGVKRAMFNSDGLYFFNTSGDTITSILSGATDVANFENIEVNGGNISNQPVANVGNVSNSTADAVPTSLAIDTTGTAVEDDGVITAYTTLSWDAISTDTFHHYVIRYKRTGYTYYNYIDVTETTITIDGLMPNVGYDFAIASVNKYGAVSAFSSTVAGTTAADAVAPSKPTGLAALGGFKKIVLDWDANTDYDLSEYHIYRYTSDVSGSAVKVGASDGSQFIDDLSAVSYTGGESDDTYYYWIKAIDTSRNASAFSDEAHVKSKLIDEDSVYYIGASKILLDGTTYLTSWRHASDFTKIDGGDIYTHSVTADEVNFTVVGSDNVVATINASAEELEIAAKYITIAGTTVFTSGWAATTNAQTDIDQTALQNSADAGADVTQTTIDGGLVTTGTVTVSQGGSVVAGITGNTSGDTSVRFWAGSSFANRAAAPYRVTQGGLVTANNADIQGLIKATSGWIGGSTSGWKIDSNVLQAYSGVTKIIELSATGPHIQCLKDSNNYVQMTPASSDPRFDVFKAGIRRIRLNEDGLTFFTDAGAETNKIGLGVTDGDVTFGGGYVRLFSGGIRISYDYSGTGLNLADESTTYLRMYVAASAQSYAGTIDLPNSDILVIRDKTGPPGNKIVDFVGRTGQGNNYGLVDVYSPIGLLATSTSPTGASNGWMFYNTTYNEVWAYIGGSWEALDHGGGATGTVTSVATSGAITGGTITTTGTISHSTSNGYKHFPSSGSTYQMIRNSAAGTGAWTSNLYIGGNSSYYIYKDASSPYDTIFEVPSGTDYAFSRGGTVYTKIDDNFWTKGNLYADGQLSVGGTIQNTVGDIIINNGNLQLKKNGAIIAIDDSGGTTRYLTVQWNATLSKYILST